MSVSVVTATIDRVGGTLGSTGGTGNLGGALLTIGAALAVEAAGNDIWVRGGTYTISAALTKLANGVDYHTDPNRLLGYGTTRGDHLRPLIQTSSAIVMLSHASGGADSETWDLEFDGTDVATNGIDTGGTGVRTFLVNCVVRRTTNVGISCGAGAEVVWGCRVTDLKAGAASAFLADSGGSFFYCQADTSPGDGLYLYVGGTAHGCIAAGMAGIGILIRDLKALTNCVAYGNGGDGVRLANVSYFFPRHITNCIMVNNGGYGVNSAGGPVTGLSLRYCATYNNTSGAINQQNADAINVGLVTLTGDPFTDGAGLDFTLNNTAGAGAACRGAGFPGVVAP